jgi:uncharacterized protein
VFLRSIWQTYVTDLREETEAASKRYRAETPLAVVDRRVAVVLLTAMLVLVAVRFFGAERESDWIPRLLDAVGLDTLAKRATYAFGKSPDSRFNQRIFWAVARVVGYAVIPLLVIRFALRDDVRHFGMRVRGILAHGKIYALLLAILAPFVVAASFGAAFQAKYPYYRLAPGEALWPYFWGWEALYAIQFAALEFFFRGFMVHGLRLPLGYASIFVMMVPYTMIHLGKPLPEALGSIIAGFVLGTLSLKSGSIWWGAVVHVSVAGSMDFLSVWRQGLL